MRWAALLASSSVALLAVAAITVAVVSPPGTPWRGAEMSVPIAAWQLVAGRQTSPVTGQRLVEADQDGRLALRVDLPKLGARQPFQYMRIDASDLPVGTRWVVRTARDGFARPLIIPRAMVPITVALPVGGDEPGTETAIVLVLEPMPLVDPQHLAGARLWVPSVTLTGDARSSALAAWLTDAFALSPWAGRSINVTGFERGEPKPWNWTTATLVAAGIALLLWLAVGQRSNGRRGSALIIVTAAGLLALPQLASLAWRANEMTRLSAAGATLAIDPGLARAARLLEVQIETLPGSGRVIVVSDSAFIGQYVASRLRRFDVAHVYSAGALAGKLRPGDTLVLPAPPAPAGGTGADPAADFPGTRLVARQPPLVALQVQDAQ